MRVLGKGNPEDFIEFSSPQARLKSEGKHIYKQLDFRHQMVPIAQPSCPTASLIIRLFDTPHRLTNSQPRAPGRRFAPAQVLFVEGAIRTGGSTMHLSQGDERRERPAAPRTRSTGGAGSAPRCPPTRPRSFRSAGFPSSPARPLASNFLGITVTSSLFQIKLKARAAGMVGFCSDAGGHTSPSFPVATSESTTPASEPPGPAAPDSE